MIKFMKKAAMALGAAMMMVAPASAGTIVYHLTNYEAGPGKHGLWTNNSNVGADRFYAFQSDMLLTIDTIAGTATMTGTAINPSGNEAVFDLSFGDFLETTLGSTFSYKQEGGLAYDEAADLLDVDFFTSATGSITIDGFAFNLRSNPFAGGTAFQYGEGANAKNSEFGGSAWLRVRGPNGETPNHWDVNFNMNAVPEPATWAMMIIGFGAVGGAMRRSKKKQPALQTA